MGEFCMGDLVSPGTRVGPTEDLKVCLNFLVDMFSFAIRLEVVGGGKGEVVVQEFPKLLGEGRCKLWTTIEDDFIVESEVEVDFVEEKGSHPFSGDHFLSGAENYPLRKAMVDHDQQRIKARGGGEVSDEVTGDLLEQARGVGLDQSERGDSGVRVGLVLLAYGTAFDILPYKLHEPRPPKFSSDELVSLQVARVSSGLMVIAASEDGVTEGVFQGNVDMTFVCEDVVIKLPVRKARPESGRDVFQGRLQVLEDEGVGLG